MLVLTRRAGETVDLMIGDKTVSITVARIRHQYGQLQASLSFDAPMDVNIVRREINEKFQECENE